ncbi:MAG: sigma 54-interacting transcriptional regulator [Clostridiales Family XIII bacterium]|jgi:DNA-binding NtrC family response regulator|nr:sigma 54-interacting transcriptional regulator [Clostridiales Family XIII bacterium]
MKRTENRSGANMVIYGAKRSVEPQNVLPTTAWRVDNSETIAAGELRVSLIKLMIEPTSFKQICAENNNDPDRIGARIMDIVSRRGKMHNPVTDTGGQLYGVVEEIGPAYENTAGIKVGDKIICNSSLASIPICVKSIGKIDMFFSSVEAQGYGIIFSKAPVVKKPDSIPSELLMYISNESGTLYHVSKAAAGKRDFLIVGDQLITNLLFGRAIRKTAGQSARIICLVDKSAGVKVDKGESLNRILRETFDEIHYVEILRPVECIEALDLDGRFDLAVNCADIPGGETINVVAAKNGGSVIFANIINNFGNALYMTEAISRDLDVRVANGYLEKYADFDIMLATELTPAFQGASFSVDRNPSHTDYPIARTKRSAEMQGYRNSLTDDFICESEAMMRVLDEILRVAKYDCNVLITGETGVGKEKVATMLFQNSARSMRPFIRVNCAAISPHLLESEFFGYEKGAFTGASDKGKKGFFEIANNGTIFLDEVSELPSDLQAKLLRVIQDGEYFKVGGTAAEKTNVRILAATNLTPDELLSKDGMRRDLYYRLNVFPIHVPGLAERKEEIPALAGHFLKKYGRKFGVEKTFSDDAVDALRARAWPGNIRELENTVQRLLIVTRADRITAMDVIREKEAGRVASRVSQTAPAENGTDFSGGLPSIIEQYEDRLIAEAYAQYGSSRKAAEALGISQSQFMRKKKRLDENRRPG